MTFQDDQLSPGYKQFDVERFVGSKAQLTN
jgi:hypothetical protein